MKVNELKNIDPNQILLVDIREPAELEEMAPIPGSINIPMRQMILDAKSGKLPNDKKIVTVCRSGGRCTVLNAELASLGYDVDMLEGGLIQNSGSW